MCVCFITAGPITKLCAWGVVTSFEQMKGSRTGLPGGEASSTHGAAARCLQDKIVTHCMELHSSIASTSLLDILTLSYRLKLPHALGGYESAWRPLYSHILNASVVSAFFLVAGSCTMLVLPVALQACMPCTWILRTTRAMMAL